MPSSSLSWNCQISHFCNSVFFSPPILRQLHCVHLHVQMIHGLIAGRWRNEKVKLSRCLHQTETCFSPWWRFIGFDSCRSLVRDFSGKIPREQGLSKLPNMQHLQIIINRCLHFHSLWMLLWGDFVIQGGRGKCGLSSFPTPPSPSVSSVSADGSSVLRLLTSKSPRRPWLLSFAHPPGPIHKQHLSALCTKYKQQ